MKIPEKHPIGGFGGISEDWANWAEQRIAELEAENKRLREAADRVVFECEADDWECSPSIEGAKQLKAALLPIEDRLIEDQ